MDNFTDFLPPLRSINDLLPHLKKNNGRRNLENDVFKKFFNK